MKIRLFPFALLLLCSSFVWSQTDQKAAFLSFKDSCRTELYKQYENKNYDEAIKTMNCIINRYDKLDKKKKKELNLEGSMFYALAGLYVAKHDEKSTVKNMKKAVHFGYKDLCTFANLISLSGKENLTLNKQLMKLGELKRLSSPDTISLSWHLTDIETHLNQNVKLEKLEIDFSILNDIPSDLNLYIALFSGSINNKYFYGGVQTKVDVTNHPGLIFSRWDERDKRAIRTDSLGYKCSSGYEGDFISVRKPFEWSKGKYKISIITDSDTLMLNGKVHRWVTMHIYSYDTGKEVKNGSLAFPGDTLILGKNLGIFLEVFGSLNQKFALKDIPEMKFSFERFLVNGHEQVKSAEANYWIEYPKYADVTYKEGKIFLTAGKKFTRKNTRIKQGRYVESVFNESDL